MPGILRSAFRVSREKTDVKEVFWYVERIIKGKRGNLDIFIINLEKLWFTILGYC